MDTDCKNRLHYEMVYILLITVFIIGLAGLAAELSRIFALTGFMVVLAATIPIWKMELSRKVVYLHNLLNVLCALLLARLLEAYTLDTLNTLISAVIGVVAMDVFSFTQRGRFTLNAKLISSTSTLARLSICLPVPGKRGLIPIIGVGDLVFYSVLMMVALKSVGADSRLLVVLPF